MGSPSGKVMRWEVRRAERNVEREESHVQWFNSLCDCLGWRFGRGLGSDMKSNAYKNEERAGESSSMLSTSILFALR